MKLIRELLFIICWPLLNLHLNPGDILLRGFLLNDLVKNEVWFKGQSFLTLPESGWPHLTMGNKVNFDSSEEEKKCKIDSVYNNDSNCLYTKHCCTHCFKYS